MWVNVPSSTRPLGWMCMMDLRRPQPPCNVITSGHCIQEVGEHKRDLKFVHERIPILGHLPAGIVVIPAAWQCDPATSDRTASLPSLDQQPQPRTPFVTPSNSIPCIYPHEH